MLQNVRLFALTFASEKENCLVACDQLLSVDGINHV
jgi:hypothetical protein